jgi:hypothetical protein
MRLGETERVKEGGLAGPDRVFAELRCQLAKADQQAQCIIAQTATEKAPP